MSSFFRSIRSGAGQVAFEADKLRRINSTQSIIKTLKEEISQTFFHAGQVAFGLYQAERVTQPELQEVCGHLAMLQAQIVARDREIEAIRAEEYMEPQRAPQYGRLCPNGHGEIPPQARFCPVCGAQAVGAPPPAASRFCPACGAALVTGARFCPACGASVPEIAPLCASPPPARPISPPPVAVMPPAPMPAAWQPSLAPPTGSGGVTPPLPAVPSTRSPSPPAEAPAKPAAEPRHCPHCGVFLISEAVFCPDCGRDVSAGAAPRMAMPEPAWPVSAVEAAAPVGPEPPPQATDEPAPPPLKGEVGSTLKDETVPAAEHVRHCPNCGAFLIPEAVFCPDCGEKMGSAESSPGER